MYRRTESSNFLWPVPGFYRVTSPFGPRMVDGEERHHNGMDIGRNIHPPQPIDGAGIVAAASGTVAAAHYSATGGHTVHIDHGGGIETRYKHNSENFVHRGDEVYRGQLIGRVGSTGRSTGPHLHFEVLYGGLHQDPELYLFNPVDYRAFVEMAAKSGTKRPMPRIPEPEPPIYPVPEAHGHEAEPPGTNGILRVLAHKVRRIGAMLFASWRAGG